MLQRGAKLSQPGGLGDSIGHGAVLSFGTGVEDSGLALGGPRDKVVPKKQIA